MRLEVVHAAAHVYRGCRHMHILKALICAWCYSYNMHRKSNFCENNHTPGFSMAVVA